MLKLTFRAMGSRIEAFTTSENQEAQDLLRQVPQWFEDWEQTLSRFRLDSELSRLNRCPNQTVTVSTTLWEVLQVALQAEEESGGLVTPAVLDALEYAGYDRSFELIQANGINPRPPAAFTLYESKPVPDVRHILLDENMQSVMLPDGLRLDFGGSAKGWAAHQAAERLSACCPAMVNAGGDIAIGNPDNDHQSWEIGIQDPFSSDAVVQTLWVNQGGVATSGIDYRRWNSAGHRQSHIIDPRTGISVQNNVVSATIIAGNLMEAEMAAKTTLLLGSQAGMDWLGERPQLAGLMVLDDRRILHTDNYEQYLRRPDERKLMGNTVNA